MRPLLSCCLLLLVVFNVRADSIPLTAVADTTISEGNAARASGLGTDLIVGGLLQFTSKCRGLLRFDLSGIPATAIVTSATVTVTVTASKPGATQHTHGLHRLRASWDEVAATWDGSGVDPWEGGDFISDADASTPFGGPASYTFDSTTGLVATVQLWLTNSATNHGWILVSESEESPGTARRVATHEAAAGQPVLTVGYSMPSAPPADFNVTSPGSFFSINGQEPNPELTLTRGSNYTFAVNTDPSHPFQIVSDLGGTPYNDGVVNNGISSGTLTFAVPQNAPDTLFYFCPNHFFSGTLRIVNPTEPAVPLVQILSMELNASNVVLKSTGTNGWLAIPEFSSNLLVSNWAVVPDFTNSFANGTNVTIFNRLEPICGSNVFLRIKNTRN